MHYYSDFNRLLRAACYILLVFRTIAARVKTNDKIKCFLSLHISPLTVVEHEKAKAFLFRCIEKECFGKLYNYIKSFKEELVKSSKKSKNCIRTI